MAVNDLSQLGDSVISGFQQLNMGVLPTTLLADLSTLRNTLSEGMTMEFHRLCEQSGNRADDAVQDAECEFFMTQQRKYESKIPGYSQITGTLLFEGF